MKKYKLIQNEVEVKELFEDIYSDEISIHNAN